MRIVIDATHWQKLRDNAEKKLAQLQHDYNIEKLKEEHEHQYRIDQYERLNFFKKLVTDDPGKPNIHTSMFIRIHSETIQLVKKINEVKRIIAALDAIPASGTREIILSDEEIILLKLKEQI